MRQKGRRKARSSVSAGRVPGPKQCVRRAGGRPGAGCQRGPPSSLPAERGSEHRPGTQGRETHYDIPPRGQPGYGGGNTKGRHQGALGGPGLAGSIRLFPIHQVESPGEGFLMPSIAAVQYDYDAERLPLGGRAA